MKENTSVAGPRSSSPEGRKLQDGGELVRRGAEADDGSDGVGGDLGRRRSPWERTSLRSLEEGDGSVAPSAAASPSRERASRGNPPRPTRGSLAPGRDVERDGVPPPPRQPNGLVGGGLPWVTGSIRPVVFPAGEKSRIPSGYRVIKRALNEVPKSWLGRILQIW